MRLTDGLKSLLWVVLRALFPKQCICCGEIIDEDEQLCDVCFHRIERIRGENRCLRCGLEKKNCECRQFAYHFEGCVAPFKNTGYAQCGFYRYKFRRRIHYADFFAREMALCVLNEYRNIHFDGICFVPASRAGLRHRGFNQCEVLARKLSQLLKIPLLEDALIRNRKGKVQHLLTLNQRFENVRGMYSGGITLNGGCVLLVDDIKTSGATLDECARQLLFSGAKCVYSVTALISAENEEKKIEKRQGLNYN